MKRYIVTVIYGITILAHSSFGQECDFTISGQITDKGSDHALEFANIFIEELATGTIADSKGNFVINGLCRKSYHLRVSHIGCETVNMFLEISKDTVIHVGLTHHAEFLNEVVVHGQEEDESSKISKSLTENHIAQQNGKVLSEILEEISGVSVMKSGSGISKPVIHGLWGNRLSIVNNGLIQSGQKWGEDHAPEIDPNVADHISVIKGVGSLEYGSNLGSIVVIEPGNIPKDNHIHGKVNYNFQTNGRGHSAHVKLEKSENWADWRFIGSTKLIGDRQTPNYFLTNTGTRENNLAFQIDKHIDNWSLGAYYSLFNTEIGVLKASEVTTVEELERALNREIPLSIDESFSYDINAPRQRVTHHLWKVHSKYALTNEKLLKFKYGGQSNQRKEFDVRRNDRTSVPILDIHLNSHFLEGIYAYSRPDNSILKSGLQFNYSENATQAGTGLLPFIPDYQVINPSAFVSYQKPISEKVFVEGGFRYDFRKIDVATISLTFPRMIERFNHSFNNFSLVTGGKYESTSGFSSNLNLGYIFRSPEVNELYSRGIHQGAFRVEYGNPNLIPEKSLKLIWTNSWLYNELLYVEASAYTQKIDDYIYLKPQIGVTEQRTVGVFPVYRYEQTNANISGMDFILKFEPGNHIEWTNKLSYIKATDTKADSALVNIPSDNISSDLSFILSDKKKIKGSKISILGKIVATNDILDAQDIASSIPDGYFVAGIKVQSNVHFKESILGLSIHVENLFNTEFRDYLNQWWRYVDDSGRNISFNLKFSF